MVGVLQVSDNTSALARFNDEKAWVEYVLTRVVPSTKSNESVLIRGIMKGVHSEWAYKQHEGSHDGIIDFKLEEEGTTTSDFIRVRTMRDVSFDREWHELKIGDNFEITLQE
jgi:KaiC/GvpD/RAD55 family RecA-like ATPase